MTAPPTAIDNTSRRSRRRPVAWLFFGLVGLFMGVTWAVGFATSSAVVDSAGAEQAPKVFGTAPGSAPASEYDGLVASGTALTIGFKGKWGKIDSDTSMFEVDLSGQTAGTFFTTVYLTNNPAGWSALQLEFLQFNSACAGVSDWSTPDASSVMVVEDEDAYASFNSMTAGGTYCIGVESTPKANDYAGTFIRRPTISASPTPPDFAATLNRSA